MRPLGLFVRRIRDRELECIGEMNRMDLVQAWAHQYYILWAFLHLSSKSCFLSLVALEFECSVIR